MMSRALIVILLGAAAASIATAQFPQMQRAREKMEASERANSDPANKAPQPPAFKTNVDVQMVLSKQSVKTFAEAKAVPVSRVVDGDQIWLYLRFTGGLGRYVHRLTDSTSDERYLLYIEIGPQSDMLAKNYVTMSFSKEDLDLTELKVDLTTGIPGRNRSIPLFVRNAANAQPAVLTNEIRLTAAPAMPRAAANYLARTPLVVDLSKGFARYPKMLAEYSITYLRGSMDKSKLPIPGKFFDAGIKAKLESTLRDQGIEPTKIYFSGDDWVEYSDQPMMVKQYRAAYAVFTYERDGHCLYGVAEAVESFDPMLNRFGASSLNIEQDLITACVATN